MISRIPDRQATKSCIPCPNFGESHFPGSSQIPNPIKIFFFFPNPAPYFGQIPDPKNTLPDPVRRVENQSTQRKTSWSKGKSQQQTQPTSDVKSRNRTQATLVVGKCSHHCAVPDPRIFCDLGVMIMVSQMLRNW